MKIGETSQRLAEKFKVSEITDLPVSDTLQLIQGLPNFNAAPLKW
jgi:hypothetical protein